MKYPGEKLNSDLREQIKCAYHSGTSHARIPSEIPEKVELHDKAGSFYDDAKLILWLKYLAKETGKELTDEYLQYCVDSWHETMMLVDKQGL